jgi:hypothetical protein
MQACLRAARNGVGRAFGAAADADACRRSAPQPPGSAPRHLGSAPRHLGSAPRHLASAPRHSGSAPRHSGSAPRHPWTERQGRTQPPLREAKTSFGARPFPTRFYRSFSTSCISTTTSAAARRCLIRLWPRCPLLRRSSRLSGLCVDNRDRPLRLIQHSPDFRAATAPASFLWGFWATANRVSETLWRRWCQGLWGLPAKAMDGEVRTRRIRFRNRSTESRNPRSATAWPQRQGGRHWRCPLNEPAIALMCDLLADPGARVFPVHKCRAWPPRRS